MCVIQKGPVCPVTLSPQFRVQRNLKEVREAGIATEGLMGILGDLGRLGVQEAW